ncbi:MAG: DUF167 domain-containing protein [Verrucomicrobiales bacterium]|nr:DUF167 domain-containing protein [Verrucomicrobiales bacterium]
MANGESAFIQVRVVPNARKTCCAGLMGDATTWKIKLAAPPVDGKANEELVEWLAQISGTSRNGIRILSGEKSRTKRIQLAEISTESLLEMLVEASR